MAVYSIGQLAERATRRAQRPRAKVRRNSFEKGTFEHRWFTRPDTVQLSQMCDGRRQVDRYLKKHCKRHARVMGDCGDAVIRAMWSALDKRTGRLDVSLAHLTDATGFSKPTVCRTLDRLETNGFVDRRRRCQRTSLAPNEAGPQWEQATNVYRLKVPPLARKLQGLRGMTKPLPEEEIERRAQQSADAKAMELAIPAEDLGSYVTADSELAEALNRLGRHLFDSGVERESRNVSQPLPSIYLKEAREAEVGLGSDE